jgi:predicted DsbA family dithiol-disulfide isomerase
VTQVAAGEGLAYDFDALRPTNTRRAHGLLHLARSHGRQDAMVERLFAAHFVEGRHVGRVDDLVELAVQVGLEAATVRAALEDGSHDAAVQADIDQAHAYGITGVPFFVVDGRFGISGAQAPRFFARALAQAAVDAEAPAGAGEPRAAGVPA